MILSKHKVNSPLVLYRIWAWWQFLSRGPYIRSNPLTFTGQAVFEIYSNNNILVIYIMYPGEGQSIPRCKTFYLRKPFFNLDILP